MFNYKKLAAAAILVALLAGAVTLIGGLAIFCLKTFGIWAYLFFAGICMTFYFSSLMSQKDADALFESFKKKKS